MRPGCERAKQGGAALLLLMLSLVLALSVAGWRYFSGDMLRNQKMERTIQALATAKAALLARAAFDENRPGSLPCPDTDNDGTADTEASGDCKNDLDVDNPYIGRFPHRTLEMDDLRDGNGERLWYVLSENFRDATGITTINANTLSDITLNGDTEVIAIIFSGGPPLAGQTGRPSIQIIDYLESNPSADRKTFITGNDPQNFNDIALPVRKDEWINAIAPRVLQMIRGYDNPSPPGGPIGGLRAYYNNLPASATKEFPASLPEALSSTCQNDKTNDDVLICNGWHNVPDIYTRDIDNTSKATLNLGRYLLDVTP